MCGAWPNTTEFLWCLNSTEFEWIIWVESGVKGKIFLSHIIVISGNFTKGQQHSTVTHDTLQTILWKESRWARCTLMGPPPRQNVVRFSLGLVWRMHLVAGLIYVAGHKCRTEGWANGLSVRRIRHPRISRCVRDCPTLEIDNLVSATGTHNSTIPRNIRSIKQVI